MWKILFTPLAFTFALSSLQAQSLESNPQAKPSPAVARTPNVAPPEVGLIEGKVVLVTDGDQIRVKTGEGNVYSVRLQGVDAPEQKQEYGVKAQKDLEDLILDKEVKVIVHRRDSQGLYMGTVFRKGQDIGLRVLENGNGWHYKRVSGEQSSDVRARYALAELKAREAKAGLWSDPMPIPPWEFREEIETVDAPVTQKAEAVSLTNKTPRAPKSEAVPGRVYVLGPRGGCYYFNAAGTKVYVDDKTLCTKP